MSIGKPKTLTTPSLKRHALSTSNVDVFELVSSPPTGSKFSSNVVALVNGMNPTEVFKYVANFGIRHVIQAKGQGRIERVKKAQEIITAGAEGLSDFPGKLLLSPPTFHSNFSFHSSDEKESVVEQAVSTVTAHSGGRRFADDVRTIADEFFTNVIYNAYHGPNSRISRTVTTKLPKDKAGELHVMGSENELMIAVFDLFGTLEIEALIQKIQKSFFLGISRSMSYSSGGAGIGCRLVLDRSQRYWVIVFPGVFTAFFSIMPFGPDARDADMDHKDVHFLKLTR
ncbi:MAG: hypothetical protein A4S09_02925 [Proteobacteria bacterium SG_bin7]|nr:MAG: hypothetical protein A4S09_02925 [Proteobacteria bacterium SG_bin7]